MKVPRGLTREEQETFFRTNATSKEWEFYSRDMKFVRRLRKKGYVVEMDHQGLYSCKLPLKGLTIRSRFVKARVYRNPLDSVRMKMKKLSKPISEIDPG